MDISKCSEQISGYLEEYKRFMGITEFPAYLLAIEKMNLDDLANMERQGRASAAEVFYDQEKGIYDLIIHDERLISKGLLFHEFTHILDIERYVRKGQTELNEAIAGFTEYHAAQVAFMLSVGANRITDTPCFCMESIIATAEGPKTVERYLMEKHELACTQFDKKDLLTDAKEINIAFGVLYNYWGMRSICEMYAPDYSEKGNNRLFAQHLSSRLFFEMNKLMHGWLDDGQIYQSAVLYSNAVFPLMADASRMQKRKQVAN